MMSDVHVVFFIIPGTYVNGWLADLDTTYSPPS